MIVPDISNPFFAAIAREVTLAAEEAGYSLLIADSRESTTNEVRLVDRLLGRRIEGLVVCPVGVSPVRLAQVQASGVPMVLIDRGFHTHELTTVTSDHATGAEQLTKLLLDAGHRHIGVLQGLPKTLPNEQRLLGVQAAYRNAKLKFSSKWIAGDNFTEESGYQATINLLASFPKLSALLAMSAPQALGALRAARKLGRIVPDDLSLFTFDDHPFVDFLQCPLTAASQDIQQLGRTAARVLLQKVKTGKKAKLTSHIVPVTITIRSSIRPVRLIQGQASVARNASRGRFVQKQEA